MLHFEGFLEMWNSIKEEGFIQGSRGRKF